MQASEAGRAPIDAERDTLPERMERAIRLFNIERDFIDAKNVARRYGRPQPRRCQKCEGVMEWGERIDDNLGNDRPAGWACECGHFIEDESQHFDQE